MRPDDPRHGTNAGYLAHMRSERRACEDCRRAHVRYEKRRKHDTHRGTPRLIDPTGTQRRIQALVALGWTYGKIGERLGISSGGVYRMIVRYGVVRRDIAERAAAVYDEMSMTLPPTRTRQEKRDASYARTVARKHGWAPPLAWDNIDDPNEIPKGIGYKPQRPDCGTEWGYRWHRRHDPDNWPLPPDDPCGCRAAHTEWTRDNRKGAAA